ncbi:MAG TPA: hypothetical protein VG095_04820, partial [Chthoniobacterales bacterium]|nr:hypothetical protein [Chthoniobacterales bacterium]
MQSESAGEKRVLGVEGGGTKTEWALVNCAGEVIARGLLPAANLRLIDDEALERLLRVLPAEITHVGVFLAGCVDDADRARLSAIVSRIWPPACVAVAKPDSRSLPTA